MTPPFAHRTADEFQRALEGRPSPARRGTAGMQELLEVVDALHRVPEVEPRPEFVSDLRSRLLTAAETDLVPAPRVLRPVDRTPAPRPAVATPRRRPVRLGTAVAALAVIAGTAGTAAAASSALPGDSLYPVKRGIEDVRTAVQVDDAGTGRSLLEEAASRLDEARALQGSGADPLLVAGAVADFRTAAGDGAAHLFRAYADGGDRGDVTAVRTFVSTHMGQISTMSQTGDRTVDDLLLEAADTLATLDQQAHALCASCGPTRVAQVPITLASASGVTINNLLARPVAQASADLAQQVQQAKAARAARAQQELDRRLRAGAADAEKAAAGVDPATPAPTTPVPEPDGGQVTSTLTPGGGLVPSVTGKAGTAVKGLVRGVTGTVGKATKTGTPLDPALGGLTDTVDGVADGLSTTLGGH
ncbi:hypothetical protein GCM10027596_20760 [Nocardioides korecus]